MLAVTMPLSAQDTLALAPGSSLRVTTQSPAMVRVGTLLRLGGDSLVLAPCGRCRPEAYALPTLVRVEVNRGTRANPVSTFAGIALGAVGGAVFGVRKTVSIGGLFVGAFGGAVLGGALGSRMRTDDWITVEVTKTTTPPVSREEARTLLPVNDPEQMPRRPP